MKPQNFFAELKRRNVYKIAVTYAIVGWLLVQIATQVFPFLEIPTWVVRLVIVLVAIGFPIALIIAWAFELTPEGIKRTEDVGLPAASGLKNRAWVYIAVIGAAFSIGLFFIGRYTARNSSSAPSSELPVKSIAVLPFAFLSDDKTNSYFADGIQDEILTRLSKIADLKVISRTSTEKYKSAPSNLREIAQQLGVSNILEGSVQKSGDAVRVNVQLINALTDAHLWADTFDRKLIDVFQVESEVAQKIAASLEAKLTGREKHEIESAGTKNPEAYDAYLRARALMSRQGSDDRKRLIEFCRRAVELDPNFAQAWADLGVAEAEKYFGDEHTQEQFERARTAAETSLRLDPDLPAAHAAIGLFYYYCLQDFDRALKELEFARERLPNNANNLLSIGVVKRRQSKLDDSIKAMEQAVQLDPRNEDIWVNLGRTYRGMRNFAQARTMFDHALSVAPDEKSIIAEKAETFVAEGDLEGATRTIAGLKVAPGDDAFGLQMTVLVYRRRFDEVLQTVSSVLTAEKNLPPLLVGVVHAGMANLHLAKGEKAMAQTLFEQAERELKDLRAKGDKSLWLADTLINVEARLGHREEVQREAEALIEQSRKDKWRYPRTEEVLARSYFALGDNDRAWPLLEHAVSAPADQSLTVANLRLDPIWDPIRNEPRFQKLIAEGRKP
jgi:TolB-like protein/Tfp pilus assembly protein PilF